MPRFLSWLLPLAAVAALAAGAVPQATGAVRPAGAAPAASAAKAKAVPSLDWPQFLHDPQHSSVSPATAFTAANSGSVTQVWRWKAPHPSGTPTPHIDASPVVAGGRVYLGVEDGNFYALDEATGTVDWSRLLDTCPNRGITATASVDPDPVTGTSTVYVSGAHDLYALDAATGAIVWQTLIGPPETNPHLYYNWSSPTVIDGHIYVGLSSGCGGPLIRGGIEELDQHTGAVLSTFWTVPEGSIGATVWATIAASKSGNGLWAAVGDECSTNFAKSCPAGNKMGYALSILHLSPTLNLQQAWRIPNATGHDWDFGASPTLFGGTGTVPASVGACNKDGNFYALAATPLGKAPLWTDTIGAPSDDTGLCIGAAIWDAANGALYIPGGSATTIGGITYGGSVDSVDPATGAYNWQTGLPCAAVGSPSADSAGVIAVGTWSCPSGSTPGGYLVNAATGAILSQLPVPGKEFSQPVFAQGNLFVAGQTSGLYAFAPGS